jgi:hypothetical protein
MFFNPNSIRICTLILLVFVFFSCKRPAGEQTQSAPEVDAVEAIPFTLDTFTEFPEEVMGCSCLLAKDSAAFAAAEYVFVHDFGQIAFVRINGEMTKFGQSSYEEIDSLTRVATYENPDFWLQIELKIGESLDYEVSRSNGKMTLRNKAGLEISSDLFGVCGC